MRLSDAVNRLKGVGPKTVAALARLGIQAVRDVLFHLPLRYEDKTHLVPLANLRVGQYALIEARIMKTWQVFHKRRSLLCQLSDGQRKITLRFFHYHSSQKQQLMHAGMTLRCYGEVRLSRLGLEMVHPEYQIVDDDAPPALADRLTAVYPTTEGVGQKLWTRLTDQALLALAREPLADFATQFDDLDMMSLKEALELVHRPPVKGADSYHKRVNAARERLAFGELLAYQLRLYALRQEVKNLRGYVFSLQDDVRQRFLAQLPFDLTTAQERVLADIDADVVSGRPMLRLLQGDVGSGKTVVAMLALLDAVSSGYQAVLMAPTEILAEQHWQSCQEYLAPLGVRLGFLAGSQSAKAHREQCQMIAEATVDVVVGTHALFQDKVQYAKLGLVVIDEQHRFGVHQRMALQRKSHDHNIMVHQLVMTATPIPRTLAMTAYADLDYSVIDALPPSRQPITTTLLAQGQRQTLIHRVNAFCDSGKQVYWVCTLIEHSEELAQQAAQDVLLELQQKMPGRRVGLVHGRMKADDKAQVMQQFVAAELDVLVATTVIEVGVNVPNACLMVIDGAERLGLAQLHQLRGRVGRGSDKSFCVLLHALRLSDEAQKRLSIMRESQDGFYLAEQDMRMRGAGEILGKRQAGVMMFRVADIERDAVLIEQAKLLMPRIQSLPDLTEQLIVRWRFDQRQELISG